MMTYRKLAHDASSFGNHTSLEADTKFIFARSLVLRLVQTVKSMQPT